MSAAKYVHPTSKKAIGGRLNLMRRAICGDSKGDQERFATQVLGIAANTYNQYEKGRSRPPPETMLVISERTGVDFNWLYREDWNGVPPDLRDKMLSLKPKNG